MALPVMFICSAVLLMMTSQLDPVYGASNAADRNLQRDLLKSALKAIAVDLETWNTISKDGFGLNTRAGNLVTIISAVNPVSTVNSANFRKTKKAPSDASVVEQTKIKDLAARAANILKGLNAMKTNLNGNPMHESKALSSIESFYKTYTSDITAIKTDWDKKSIQEILAFQD